MMLLFLSLTVGYFIYSKCCRAEEEVTRPLRHTEYNYRGYKQIDQFVDSSARSWGSNFYFIWCGDPYYHTGIGPCSGEFSYLDPSHV